MNNTNKDNNNNNNNNNKVTKRTDPVIININFGELYIWKFRFKALWKWNKNGVSLITEFDRRDFPIWQ